MLKNNFPFMPTTVPITTLNGTYSTYAIPASVNVAALDATANDIRTGKAAITNSGYQLGEKDIPSFETTEGKKVVLPNQSFSILLSEKDAYNYTGLQIIICLLNTTVDDSVAAEKVVIDNAVYAVNSIIKLSDVVKDVDNKTINLSITNDTENTYVMHYFTNKEVV